MAGNKKKQPEDFLSAYERVLWREDREATEGSLAGGILILILLILFFPLGIVAALIYWVSLMARQKPPKQTVFITSQRVLVVEDGEMQLYVGLALIEAIAMKKDGVALITREGETLAVTLKSPYGFAHNLRQAVSQVLGRELSIYGGM